jgi:hypothetical protein
MAESLSALRSGATAPNQKISPFIASGRDFVAPAAVGSTRRKPGLGTSAKSFVKRVEPVEGEVEVASGFDAMHARTERYALQEVAQRLLPKSRTAKCLHFMQKDRAVSILRSQAHGTTSYSGLQTCASVWTCAVCSAKISERRRVELLEAMDVIRAETGHISMMTLTTPHQRTNVLKDLLAQQAKALAIFNADRQVREVLGGDGLACIGQVRALEVTTGRKNQKHNGWHPHYHIILMHGRLCFLPAVEQRLYERWVHACEKAGLGTPSEEHGLKLHDGSHAAEYATKWGLDREMTSGHTKKSRHGETPFDLLRALRDDPEDVQAGILFKEFAAAFHGKRQLFWSPGLKAKCRLEEKSDSEKEAEKSEDDCIEIGTLTTQQWMDVRKAPSRVDRRLASLPEIFRDHP